MPQRKYRELTQLLYIDMADHAQVPSHKNLITKQAILHFEENATRINPFGLEAIK